MNKNDEQIVNIVLSGNVDAFEEIVNRYEKSLLRYIISLGIHHPHTEDVLQNIFIKAYRNLNSYNAQYKFSSWIYRIAHNEAISLHRKNKHTVKFNHEEEHLFWVGVASEEDLLLDLLDKEVNREKEKNKEKLMKAIQKLDIKYSAPLVLYFLKGKQYDEISDILQIPTSTVGTRIRRAKEKLRLLYNEKNTEI